MQKRLLLVGILIFILTGCTRIDNDDQNYVGLVVNCLNNKAITNDVALGYKYYLPRGVKLVKNYDYNQKFLIDDTYLYMFVDINSYYYKSSINYNDDNDYFYYQKISYDGKNGYIKITDDDDSYFTEILYNYAKVEFYSDYNSLNKMITLSSIVLNSIDYNDVIIEKVLMENSGSSSEITYEIAKPDDASNNFSQYLEEYVQEDEEENLPDK